MRATFRAAALLVPLMIVVVAQADGRERASFRRRQRARALPVAQGHARGGQSQLR